MMAGGWSVAGVEGQKRQGLRFATQLPYTLKQTASTIGHQIAQNTPILSMYFMGLVGAEFDGGNGISRGREKIVGWVKNSLNF